ncbi:MAG: amidohydrolase family protein [Candidatus Promineifilaceae bacterium]|nr:amidohydrolase family protein [Candidatus Promineifilaceae bacterium]
MAGTIILPDWLIHNPQETPRRECGVRVVGDQIDDVAPNGELREKYPDDQVWQASGQVLAPGFVNAHSHLYGILAHGIPLENAPSGFWPFLEDFWWPLVEDQLTHELICTATDLQCARMLQSGVTSFYDCTEAPYALPGVLMAQAEVVRKRGLRGILSFEATERVSAQNGQLGLQENAAFVESCRELGGLVSGLICFHTTFTCSAPFIQQAFDLGRDLGVAVHMHCSEGTHEPEYALERFGQRPLFYYESLGVAGPDMIASQCVQVDEREIALMAERGIRMTHMPLSNCEVGGGIAPVPELVAAGVTVGLGSDGYIDNFFEVMRGAFLIHKANHRDPRVMPADVVWHLATEGGARALGLEKVGRLEAGWQADLQLIEAQLPTPLSAHNLYEQLLLYRNRTDVAATMVAGQIRVAEGEILDVDMQQLMARCHEAAAELWSKAAA